MSDDLPIVGRPRGSAWRQLQSEGILWEGQILVAGDDTDLAALLIVTNERLSLVRGGAVALDIDHGWLCAPPVVRRTGTVGLQVLTPGQRLPESLTFIIREGRLAAAELVDILTPQERFEPEFPTWNSDTFLDEEPIIPARRAPYERKHTPAPVDPLPPFPIYASLDDDDFPPIAPPPDPMPDWSGGTPQLTAGGTNDPVSIVGPRPNDWNLKPLDGMDNRERRDRRAWAMRFAAICLVVAGIGVWQSGLLPDYNTVRDRFVQSTPVYTVAQRPAATPTEPVNTTPTENAVQPTATATIAEQAPSSTEQKPTYAPAEQTALALGVGGPEGTPVSSEPVTSTAPIIEPPVSEQTEPAIESTSDTTEQENPSVAETAVVPTEPAPSVMPTEQPQAPASTTALDYEITDLQIGTSLPDLTLGPLRSEQWVVVTLDIKNRGNDIATLDLSAFHLTTANGDELEPDSATGAVATFLGLSSSTGTREIGPGERTAAVLVFLPSADATGLSLETDTGSIPLEVGSSGRLATDLPPSSTDRTADHISTQLLTYTLEQFTIGTPSATANARSIPVLGQP